MRARNLKPSVFKNELLGSADPLITILFEGLWCCADREGRLEDRPLRICAEVFPYRRAVTEKKVEAWLGWLHEHGFIVRYEAGSAKAIQVVNFLKHQRPHSKESPSQIQSLESFEHQPRKVLAPTKVRPEPGKGSGEHALTPESPFLNPESSLRETRARSESRTGPTPDRNGSSEPSQAHELTERIKAIYPAGIYRDSNWLLAERAISKLLDAGENPDEILALARAFAEQQQAKGSSGSQFVLSPENFFGPKNHWRGPFQLPQASSPKVQRLKSATEIAEEYEARERQAAGVSP